MELKYKLEIVYNWQNRTQTDIKQKHIEALEESAEKRIFEMFKQGYTSGELFDNIYMDDEDTENGVDYSGWWELKKYIIE